MNTDWQQRVTHHLLGMLDNHTDGEVRAYLYEGDAETARYAVEARQALQRLFDRLEPEPPRAAVRENLLNRMVTTPGESARRMQSTVRYRRLIESASHRMQQFEPSHRLGSLAAMVALLIVSITAVLINDQRPASVIGRAERSTTAETANATAGPNATTDLANLLSVVRSYFEIVPLQSQAPQHADGGQLLWDRQHQVCYIFSPMLQPTGPDAMYHLWLTPPEADPVPVGQFDVDDAGRGWLQMDLPEHNTTFAKATISRGANNASTSPIEELLVGRLSR